MEPEKQSVAQGAASKKSNKWWYIVGGIVVLLVLARLATGAAFHAVTGMDMQTLSLIHI